MATRIGLTTSPPRTQAFLFHHRPRFGVFSGINPFAWPLRGRPRVALELTDQSVRCTVVAGHARWLAERLQLPDLKERVKTEQVTVFEFARNGYEINWPKYDMGTLFQIGEPGATPWTVSFTHIRNYGGEIGTSWWDIINMLMNSQSILHEGAGRGVRGEWRQALDPKQGPPSAGI
jgi:hypothetical protein